MYHLKQGNVCHSSSMRQRGFLINIESTTNFEEYLRMNLTPEWCSQYIAYEDMKEWLVDIVHKAPSFNMIDQNFSRQQYFRRAGEEFFQVETQFL